MILFVKIKNVLKDLIPVSQVPVDLELPVVLGQMEILFAGLFKLPSILIAKIYSLQSHRRLSIDYLITFTQTVSLKTFKDIGKVYLPYLLQKLQNQKCKTEKMST